MYFKSSPYFFDSLFVCAPIPFIWFRLSFTELCARSRWVTGSEGRVEVRCSILEYFKKGEKNWLEGLIYMITSFSHYRTSSNGKMWSDVIWLWGQEVVNSFSNSWCDNPLEENSLVWWEVWGHSVLIKQFSLFEL